MKQLASTYTEQEEINLVATSLLECKAKIDRNRDFRWRVGWTWRARRKERVEIEVCTEDEGRTWCEGSVKIKERA